MEQRVVRFRALHQNVWFGVFNWVLCELRRTTPRADRSILVHARRSVLRDHVWFFDYKQLKYPRYMYQFMW